MMSDALHSAEALCEVLLVQIEVELEYLCAHAQSGRSAQTMLPR